MKSLFGEYFLLFILSALFALTACKQPETVVVDSSPTTIATDTSDAQLPDEAEAGFRELLIGEHLPISSLDPLFVTNASSMRAAQLIYEGLIRLDSDGDLTPGLAESWQVNNDSLTYTFTLRSDIFYQDSDIFNTGIGRKFKAEDVKYIFERMAKVNVPPTAAQLFMNIKGFNSYYQEQRLVYNPKERNIESISGISTPHEQTVIIELERPDPSFLRKLATPLALIYPKEAVGQSVDGFTPVGAGPFSFSQRNSSSTLTFTKFNNYHNAADININRVDIMVSDSESDLFRSMGTGDLHVLPQLGPQQMQNLIDSTSGQLLDSYADRYLLQQSGGTEYVLRHNTNSSLSSSGAQAIAGFLAADSTSFFDKFPQDYVTFQASDTVNTTSDLSELDTQVYSVYSDDPFVRTFMGDLANKLSEFDIAMQMMQIRAPSRNTGLLITTNYPLIPSPQWNAHPALFRFTVQQLAVQRSEINNLHFNQYPWWFNLRGVTLPAAENLN